MGEQLKVPTQEELKGQVREALDLAHDATHASRGESNLYFQDHSGKGFNRDHFEIGGEVAGSDTLKLSKHGRRIDARVRRDRGPDQVRVHSYTYEASSQEKMRGTDQDRASTTLKRSDAEGRIIREHTSDNPLVARMIGDIAASAVKKQAAEAARRITDETGQEQKAA